MIDYSAVALSTIVRQLATDGKSYPIAYASHCCVGAKTCLISSEVELLALVFGVFKFHQYLSCVKVTIYTNNGGMIYLNNSRGKNSKLIFWALLLANYDFAIRYCPGMTNANANGLSHTN